MQRFKIYASIFFFFCASSVRICLRNLVTKNIASISKLESVQRAFTKRIPSNSDKSYADRLEDLRLHSLECRRVTSDLVYLYKMLNDQVTLDRTHILARNNNTRCRGHGMKLKVPLCRLSATKQAFHVRVINMWNALVPMIIKSPNHVSFKRNYLSLNCQCFQHA